MDITLKVGAQTDPVKLASSIMKSLREDNKVEIVAIGNNSIAVAARGLAILNSFAEKENMLLNYIPSYKKITDQGDKEVSAITFQIFNR